MFAVFAYHGVIIPEIMKLANEVLGMAFDVRVPTRKLHFGSDDETTDKRLSVSEIPI